MEDGTRELFISLVKSSLFALCRNKNLLNTVSKIDGLIGITLENKEVLLINISEYLTTHTHDSPASTKVKGPGPGSITCGKTFPESDKVYVYLNTQEGGVETETNTADTVEAITILPSVSDEAASCLPTHTDTQMFHSDDGLVDEEMDEGGAVKEKSSKKRKKRKSNKIPIMNVQLPDEYKDYMAVDEQPCCKCHPRSSGVCIRCHPEGSKCNASCKNRNCQWRHIQHILENKDTPSHYTDIIQNIAEQRDSSELSPQLDTEGEAMCLASGWLDPPDPAESDLNILQMTKKDVLDIYSGVDNYPNFACAIMCEAFSEEERLVECNVQGWAKRPKLDTDPDQTKINAIYSLTYGMFRIPEEDQEQAKKKIITSIDCRNRHLRFSQQRKKQKESMTFKIETT